MSTDVKVLLDIVSRLTQAIEHQDRAFSLLGTNLETLKEFAAQRRALIKESRDALINSMSQDRSPNPKRSMTDDEIVELLVPGSVFTTEAFEQTFGISRDYVLDCMRRLAAAGHLKLHRNVYDGETGALLEERPLEDGYALDDYPGKLIRHRIMAVVCQPTTIAKPDWLHGKDPDVEYYLSLKHALRQLGIELNGVTVPEHNPSMVWITIWTLETGYIGEWYDTRLHKNDPVSLATCIRITLNTRLRESSSPKRSSPSQPEPAISEPQEDP